MITVNNLSISFSGIPLFQNISFVVADNERIALVENGVGKTTLLKILPKNYADEGDIVITKGHRIAIYLKKESHNP